VEQVMSCHVMMCTVSLTIMERTRVLYGSDIFYILLTGKLDWYGDSTRQGNVVVTFNGGRYILSFTLGFCTLQLKYLVQDI